MTGRDGMTFLAGHERAELDALRDALHIIDVWQWPLSDQCRVELRFAGQRPTYRELQALQQHLAVLMELVTPLHRDNARDTERTE
jgi:hypothetical protein